MSQLNFIKGKYLDMIASYTSTGRWSSLFFLLKPVGGGESIFFWLGVRTRET